MGQPVFELRDLEVRNQVRIFSSNYSLYQSLSNRMMAILEEQSPRISPYSIDECFHGSMVLPTRRLGADRHRQK